MQAEMPAPSLSWKSSEASPRLCSLSTQRKLQIKQRAFSVFWQPPSDSNKIVRLLHDQTADARYVFHAVIARHPTAVYPIMNSDTIVNKLYEFTLQFSIGQNP